MDGPNEPDGESGTGVTGVSRPDPDGSTRGRASMREVANLADVGDLVGIARACPDIPT